MKNQEAKEGNNIITLIIPTHRPEFLESLIYSISEQFTKPDRIIFILDQATETETEELIRKKKFLFQGLHDTKIYIVRSGLTGALNAFKQCFRQMEQFYDKTKNNYYQIIEDDVSYLTKRSLKYITDFIKAEQPEFFYVNVIDRLDDEFITDINFSDKIEYYDNSPDSKHSIILDTCGMVFCFNDQNYNKIRTFNKIIKNLSYTLIADSFAFQFFASNLKFKLLNKTCIQSRIHNNQISANLESQIKENSIQWKREFKKHGIFNNHIKFDTYNQFLIKILSCIKYLNLDTRVEPIKPDYKFLKKLYLILINNSNLDTLLSFIINNQGYFVWFYNKSLEVDKQYIDINPYLKEKLNGTKN